MHKLSPCMPSLCHLPNNQYCLTIQICDWYNLLTIECFPHFFMVIGLDKGYEIRFLASVSTMEFLVHYANDSCSGLCCGNDLELPLWGSSKTLPQHMFNKLIMCDNLRYGEKRKSYTWIIPSDSLPVELWVYVEVIHNTHMLRFCSVHCLHAGSIQQCQYSYLYFLCPMRTGKMFVAKIYIYFPLSSKVCGRN